MVVGVDIGADNIAVVTMERSRINLIFGARRIRERVKGRMTYRYTEDYASWLGGFVDFCVRDHARVYVEDVYYRRFRTAYEQLHRVKSEFLFAFGSEGAGDLLTWVSPSRWQSLMLAPKASALLRRKREALEAESVASAVAFLHALGLNDTAELMKDNPHLCDALNIARYGVRYGNE